MLNEQCKKEDKSYESPLLAISVKLDNQLGYKTPGLLMDVCRNKRGNATIDIIYTKDGILIASKRENTKEMMNRGNLYIYSLRMR